MRFLLFLFMWLVVGWFTFLMSGAIVRADLAQTLLGLYFAASFVGLCMVFIAIAIQSASWDYIGKLIEGKE